MSAPLNLARRPLRNELLPTLLLALASAILVLLTARHAVLAIQLRHGGARDVEGQVAALDAETDRLRAEAAELRRTQPTRERLQEWAAVKELVDRRAFSWTGLLAALEQALPPTVRLVSITPSAARDATVVALGAVGQRAEDAIALVKALQASPAFEGAFLDSVGEGRDGVEIGCSVRYVGRPRPAAAREAAATVPAASAASSGSSGSGGGR